VRAARYFGAREATSFWKRGSSRSSAGVNLGGVETSYNIATILAAIAIIFVLLT